MVEPDYYTPRRFCPSCKKICHTHCKDIITSIDMIDGTTRELVYAGIYCDECDSLLCERDADYKIEKLLKTFEEEQNEKLRTGNEGN